MRRLDEQSRFDVILLRGYELIRRVVDDGAFAGRLWPYLTDIPQSVGDMDAEHIGHLTEIALASRFLLCQTEELRGFLEGLMPAACGRSVLFSPIVPVPEFAPRPPHAPSPPVKLVYSGKFAPLWNTMPMTELPARLAGLGIPAELHAIGEKVVADPDDLPWRARMIKALQSTPGVTWHGGRSRQSSMRLAAEGDFGLGWRDRSMDGSLELSTKVLEYGAIGLPVVLEDRTPMRESLLGVDYPLFARTLDEVARAIASAVERPAVYAEAAARCVAAAQRFSMPEAVRQVGHLLDVAFPPGLPTEVPRPVRVVVAGHDLRFFRAVLDRLAGDAGR